jgi:hypothetical protein
MLQALYASGSLITIFLLVHISLYRNISILSKLVLLSVAILPLGKLIYLPISGLMGLKFQFIFSSIVGVLWFFKKGFNRNMLIILLPIFVSLISIFFLKDYSQIFFYKYVELAGFDAGNYTGGMESILLRFFSISALLIYMSCIFSFIDENRDHVYLIAKYYVSGVIFASLVGIFIFIQVWFGNISVADLAPISADSHLVGNFYRFNPGANVNEFSMLVAFAIFLLPFCNLSNQKLILCLSFFILCEFAGLTRSSWIGLLLGLIIGAFYVKKPILIFWYFTSFSFFVFMVFLFLYSYVPEVKVLIDTRLALDIGVSGNERLDKFGFVFTEVRSSILRFIFGFGWATNLYVHNVYLQLLYETGIFGLFAFIFLFLYLIKDVFKLKPSIEKSSLVALFVFIACSAFFQHTLYHTQTWLILAFIAGTTKVFLANTKLNG